MSKRINWRPWIPSVIIWTIVFALSLLDVTGTVHVPGPVLYVGAAVYWLSLPLTLWRGRRASWRVNDDRRPSWAKDGD